MVALMMALVGKGIDRVQAQTIPVPESMPLNPTGGPTQRSAPIGGSTGAAVLPSNSTELLNRPSLLGSVGGIRTRLGQYGITLGLTETDELLGNPIGGIRRGTVYEGVTQMQLGIDLATAVGLPGGTINVSALQVHGRSISFNQIGNLNTVSSFEATRATRLFELWYGQSFLGGQVNIRIGQQSADQEFQLSLYAGTFVNASFGWPTLSASDLPSGGPAFPLATPGVRIRLSPSALPSISVLAGLYNGNPAGPGLADPQVRDPSGTGFRVSDGAFAISELQYAVNGSKGAKGLPGTYKLGGWYSSKSLNDQRFANATTPNPARGGNYAVYAIADQLLWRPALAPDGGVGAFVRVTAAPASRNLVDFFADAGLTFRAPFPGRVNDTAGVGIGYAHASKTGALQAGLPGVHGAEAILDVTYQAQLTPWFQLQPDFQYVFNPGAHAPNPSRPGQRIPDAAIFGIRTALNF